MAMEEGSNGQVLKTESIPESGTSTNSIVHFDLDPQNGTCLRVQVRV